MVKYTGRGLVVKRLGALSKVQMLNLVLGVGVFSLLSNINSLQTRCIVKGEAQKSPLFRRFSGGLIFSGSPVL